MDELTADAGLTRGALYHNFGDKKGLLAAVIAQIDGEMALLFWGDPSQWPSQRNRQASIRIISVFNLESQIGADGAAWHDRRLVTPDASDLALAGFGQQVRDATDRRHIQHGDATRRQDGRTFYRRNLLATLREREVASVGAEIAASKARPFRVATDGETSSGNFAIVEQSHEFTIVHCGDCERPPAWPRSRGRRGSLSGKGGRRFSHHCYRFFITNDFVNGRCAQHSTHCLAAIDGSYWSWRS